MTRTYKFKSPAKINIGLRVLSKRKDGYHNIETIFYPIALYDYIRVSIKKIQSNENIIDVKTSSKEKIDNRKNICYHAVKLFLEEFNIKEKHEIKIFIKKNIPVGAGLGGGSSDAATALKFLAEYFSILTNLTNLAINLGSDVPFFLNPKPSYATSRGEKLKLLPKFKVKDKILIVNKGVHVSTRWAYNQVRRHHRQGGTFRKAKGKTLNQINSFTYNSETFTNDFEKIVFKKYPSVEKIKEKMFDLGAKFSLMSGSGSTLYGFFDAKKIKPAKKYFSGLGYFTYISD